MIIKNLIFDLDGTLIDSSDGVVEAVNYSLRQMGQPEQLPERIKTYIGYPLSVMYPDFTDAPVNELYSHFQVKAKESVVNSTVMLPGVETMLRRLTGEGYKLGIGTTKIRQHVTAIVDKFDWEHIFAATTGGDEVKHVKPAPDVFQLTMERMGAIPLETIIIGDTENDIIAAHAAGLKCVAVSSPYGGDERLLAAEPDFFIESLDRLESAITHLSEEVA